MLQWMRHSWAVMFSIALLIVGCKQPTTGPLIEQFSGPTMGTDYNVKIVSAKPGDIDTSALQTVVDDVLAQVNSRMSNYIEDSEISRFNNWRSTEPFKLSEDTLEVLDLARQIGFETGGSFDITVAPLVTAWGFGPPGRAPDPPAKDEIEALLTQTGWDRVELNRTDSTATKDHQAITADLSAIAKGFAVDRVFETLEDSNLDNFMVEIGGEVRARGRNLQGEPWRIGIERPVPGERAIDLVVPLSNLAMATSGDYRNYYEIEGKRISHTIDPRTGYPITHNVASVSVVHTSCAAADAYATGLLVLGPEGFDLAEQLGLAAYVLFRDSGEVFMGRMTSAFKRHLDEATTPSPALE